jgi:hypothetical protein
VTYTEGIAVTKKLEGELEFDMEKLLGLPIGAELELEYEIKKEKKFEMDGPGRFMQKIRAYHYYGNKNETPPIPFYIENKKYDRDNWVRIKTEVFDNKQVPVSERIHDS